MIKVENGITRGSGDKRYWTVATDQVGLTGNKTGSFDFTTTGIGTDSQHIISKSANGADVNLTIRNTAAAASTDETVSIIAQTETSNNVMGKVVFGRISDYVGVANRDSFMDFYTTTSGSDTLALRIDENQNFNFQDGNLTTTLGTGTFKNLITSTTENTVIETWENEDGRKMNLLTPDKDDDNSPWILGSPNALTFNIDAIPVLELDFDRDIHIPADDKKFFWGAGDDLSKYWGGSQAFEEQIIANSVWRWRNTTAESTDNFVRWQIFLESTGGLSKNVFSINTRLSDITAATHKSEITLKAANSTGGNEDILVISGDDWDFQDGDVQMGGDAFWVNDGSGLPFGAMGQENVPTTVTINTAGIAEIVDGMTGGETNLVTFQNSQELKVLKAGRYLITWALSFNMVSGSGQEVEGAIGKGGIVQSAGSAHRKIGTGNDTGSMCGNTILDLAVDDLITIMVTNESTTVGVVIAHASLTLMQVGGT